MLTIVRDEMGMTPLYYWRENPSINGRSVLELLKKGVPRRLSVEGFWSYMLCGAVQEPYTLIENVYSLPPGCRLTYDSNGANCKVEHYWQPSFELGDWTRESAQAAVTAAIEKVVAKTCCRDAFLSGGIDSSAIVSVMRRLWPEDEIRTYCLIHEDPKTDEREWARLVAAQNHTRHTEFLLTEQMIKDTIGEALDSYDQPTMDGLNCYLATRFVAGVGVKKLLSGEGGDELFAGYGQYRKPRQAYAVASHLRGLRGAFGVAGFGRLMTRLATQEKFKKLGQLLSSDYDPYFLTRRQFDPEWVARLLIRANPLPVSLSTFFKGLQEAVGTDVDFGSDFVNRSAWMETRHNLLSMYIRDGIQNGDVLGVDVATPLMDKELAELLFTIPGEFKCDAILSKPFLIAAAGSGMPEACIHRRKQGFALPFDLYFQSALREPLDAFVRGGGCGLFRQSEIAKIWNAYRAGKTSWMRVWQPFVLDWWLQHNKVDFN